MDPLIDLSFKTLVKLSKVQIFPLSSSLSFTNRMPLLTQFKKIIIHFLCIAHYNCQIWAVVVNRHLTLHLIGIEILNSFRAQTTSL